MTGLRLERRDGVALLRMDWAAPVNILSLRHLEELIEAIDGAVQGAGALLLTGNGRGSFAAGADLGEIASLDPVAALDLSLAGRRAVSRLAEAPVPTAAIVDGHALGGGFDLAMSCDIVVATVRSRFGHPGITRGFFSGWGGTARLPRLTGSAVRAALTTGDSLTAHQARDAGLLFAVCRTPGAALARALAAVRQLAGWPASARDAWRASARAARERGLASALARAAAR